MDHNLIIKALVAENPAASTAYEALSSIGGEVYVVGGAVRDVMLGKNPKDIDLMVSNVPEDALEDALKSAGGRLDLTGKQFGVYRFKIKGEEVEIALPRVEKSTGAGHKDFKVDYDHRIPVETDLQRRDFTANAMAIDLNAIDAGQDGLVDPYGGTDDLQNGILRLVHPNAFYDDPLRIVRAIVAYARHGLMPDEKTEQALKDNADKVRNLAPERIQMELDKLLAAPDPASALELAHRSGVLKYILPEVDSAFGFNQNNRFHDLDVGSHLMQVLRAMSENSNDPDLRLAALLHDIGKPDSYWEDDEGNGHFYEHPDHPESADHEDLGADMAYELMNRLRYPNTRIQRVETLIRNHMWPYFNNQRGARKFLQSINGDEQTAHDLMRLRAADARGKHDLGMTDFDQQALQKAQDNLQITLDNQNAVTVKDLVISGSDLIDAGIKPGPEMGVILNELLEEVVSNPALNNKSYLIQRAQQIDVSRSP